METNIPDKTELMEQAIVIKTIRYLAKYFEQEYVDPDNKEDSNLNALEYALEAMEAIVKYVDTREEKRSYEILTNQQTYEEFVIVLERDSWIDTIVSIFESR